MIVRLIFLTALLAWTDLPSANCGVIQLPNQEFTGQEIHIQLNFASEWKLNPRGPSQIQLQGVGDISTEKHRVELKDSSADFYAIKKIRPGKYNSQGRIFICKKGATSICKVIQFTSNLTLKQSEQTVEWKISL